MRNLFFERILCAHKWHVSISFWICSLKNQLVEKTIVLLISASSELITINECNRDYFYWKVFGFGFMHLKNSTTFAPETMKNGPFVYRLGRMVFIHVRAVRFRYGLQFINTILKSLENYFSRLFLVLVLVCLL